MLNKFDVGIFFLIFSRPPGRYYGSLQNSEPRIFSKLFFFFRLLGFAIKNAEELYLNVDILTQHVFTVTIRNNDKTLSLLYNDFIYIRAAKKKKSQIHSGPW